MIAEHLLGRTRILQKFSVLTKDDDVQAREESLGLSLSASCKFFLRNGKKTCAENVLAQAVDISRRNPLADSETPKILDAYADILKSSGKLQEAQRLRAEAKRIRATMALTVSVRKR